MPLHKHLIFLLKRAQKTWEGLLIAFVFCFFFLNYEPIVVVVLASCVQLFARWRTVACQALFCPWDSRRRMSKWIAISTLWIFSTQVSNQGGSPALLAGFYPSGATGRPGNFGKSRTRLYIPPYIFAIVLSSLIKIFVEFNTKLSKT